MTKILESILKLDTELLLFFNGFHAQWLDPIMMTATKTLIWLPLYFAFIYLIIKKNKRWDIFYILLGLALTVALADQITSSFMKPFFARLRPSQDPGLKGLIHTVDNYKGGLYGFASSHAANTFSVSMFIYLLFKKKYPWISALFIWAAFVSYTRVYLGVHYPGDVFVGALIGLLCGQTGYRLAGWTARKLNKVDSQVKSQ